MNIIPAIDLYDNKCVRLKQGEFENISEYSIDPLSCAIDFAAEGAREVHIVDLNGASNGFPIHFDTILNIKKLTPLLIQCGGGFRSHESITKALDTPMDRIVIGSLAVTNPELVSSLIQEYGADRFVLAFDIVTDNDFLIAINGWREKTSLLLWDMLDHYKIFKNLRILCTDINRDGMLLGPNYNLYQACVEKYPCFHFQASGGIGKLQDFNQLKKTGVSSVIVGKALYEGHINLNAALLEVATC